MRTYDGPPLHRPETYAHGFPYDVFRDLRDHDPVSHHEHPLWEGGYWVVARHADVQRVSRDWNAFHNAPNPFLPGDAELVDESGSSLLMISLDPPEHTKLRKLISSGFTPRRINDLAIQVKARVDSARAFSDVSVNHFEGAYWTIWLAEAAAMAGEKEQALGLIRRLLETPGLLTPAWLRIDPWFASLRQDPAFRKLAGL